MGVVAPGRCPATCCTEKRGGMLDLLKRIHLFSNLDDKALSALANVAQRLVYEPGAVLCQ